MFFSWYAADYITDQDFENASPEDKANPSRGSWQDSNYLEQQQRRLPAHKYRRLHLNLPGLPEGSALSVEKVMEAVERSVRVRLPLPEVNYTAFVDMSGGSNDDATLAIAHRDAGGRAILDLLADQGQRPSFDPRKAVGTFSVLSARPHIVKDALPMGRGSLTICLRASISLWEIVSREQEIVLSEPRSQNVHSHWGLDYYLLSLRWAFASWSGGCHTKCGPGPQPSRS